MPIRAGWFTPMLHVASIEASIAWYERLGFELVDTDRRVPIGWARMHCQGGAVMFLRAEEAVDSKAQAVMFWMYVADLPLMRDELRAQGVETGEIEYPDHGPWGEVHLRDPDGYFVGIVHWGEKEHTEWLARIGREAV